MNPTVENMGSDSFTPSDFSCRTQNALHSFSQLLASKWQWSPWANIHPIGSYSHQSPWLTYPGYPKTKSVQRGALSRAAALAPATASCQLEPATSPPKAPQGPWECSKAGSGEHSEKLCIFSHCWPSAEAADVDAEQEAAAPPAAQLPPTHGAPEPPCISSLGTLLCFGLFLTWRKHTACDGRVYHCLLKAWLTVNSFCISCRVLLLWNSFPSNRSKLENRLW